MPKWKSKNFGRIWFFDRETFKQQLVRLKTVRNDEKTEHPVFNNIWKIYMILLRLTICYNKNPSYAFKFYYFSRRYIQSVMLRSFDCWTPSSPVLPQFGRGAFELEIKFSRFSLVQQNNPLSPFTNQGGGALCLSKAGSTL